MTLTKEEIELLKIILDADQTEDLITELIEDDEESEDLKITLDDLVIKLGYQ